MNMGATAHPDPTTAPAAGRTAGATSVSATVTAVVNEHLMRPGPEQVVRDEVADLVAQRLHGVLVVAEMLTRIDAACGRLVGGLRDRAVDESRVDLAQSLVPNSEPVEHGRMIYYN